MSENSRTGSVVLILAAASASFGVITLFSQRSALEAQEKRLSAVEERLAPRKTAEPPAPAAPKGGDVLSFGPREPFFTSYALKAPPLEMGAPCVVPNTEMRLTVLDVCGDWVMVRYEPTAPYDDAADSESCPSAGGVVAMTIGRFDDYRYTADGGTDDVKAAADRRTDLFKHFPTPM